MGSMSEEVQMNGRTMTVDEDSVEEPNGVHIDDAAGSSSKSGNEDAVSVHSDQSDDSDGDSDGVHVNYRLKDKKQRLGWHRHNGLSGGAPNGLHSNGNGASTESDDGMDGNDDIMEIRIHPFIDIAIDGHRECMLCHRDADTEGCCFIRSADSERPRAMMKELMKMYAEHTAGQLEV